MIQWALLRNIHPVHPVFGSPQNILRSKGCTDCSLHASAGTLAPNLQLQATWGQFASLTNRNLKNCPKWAITINDWGRGQKVTPGPQLIFQKCHPFSLAYSEGILGLLHSGFMWVHVFWSFMIFQPSRPFPCWLCLPLTATPRVLQLNWKPILKRYPRYPIQDQGCGTTTPHRRRSLPLVKNEARVDDKSWKKTLPITQYIESHARATCTVWLGLRKLLCKFLSLKAFPAFKDVASMTPMTIATEKSSIWRCEIFSRWSCNRLQGQKWSLLEVVKAKRKGRCCEMVHVGCGRWALSPESLKLSCLPNPSNFPAKNHLVQTHRKNSHQLHAWNATFLKSKRQRENT